VGSNGEHHGDAGGDMGRKRPRDGHAQDAQGQSRALPGPPPAGNGEPLPPPPVFQVGAQLHTCHLLAQPESHVLRSRALQLSHLRCQCTP
jgi:hypothetical protein